MKILIECKDYDYNKDNKGTVVCHEVRYFTNNLGAIKEVIDKHLKNTSVKELNQWQGDS